MLGPIDECEILVRPTGVDVEWTEKLSIASISELVRAIECCLVVKLRARFRILATGSLGLRQVYSDGLIVSYLGAKYVASQNTFTTFEILIEGDHRQRRESRVRLKESTASLGRDQANRQKDGQHGTLSNYY